jgi:hypothetical protein
MDLPDYRALAEACGSHAERIHDLTLRNGFEKIARLCRQLAGQVDQLNAQRPAKPRLRVVR